MQRGPRSLSRRNSLARGSRLVDRLIAAADSRRLWSHRRAVGLCLFCYSSFADPLSFYLGRHHFWRGGSPHWSRVWERRVRGVARSVHLKHTHTQGGEVKGESEKTKTAHANANFAGCRADNVTAAVNEARQALARQRAQRKTKTRKRENTDADPLSGQRRNIERPVQQDPHPCRVEAPQKPGQPMLGTCASDPPTAQGLAMPTVLA